MNFTTIVVVKVREMIRELHADGWFQVRQRGSHRQFRHATKLGTVTVPGALGEDLHIELISSIVRQAGLERRKR
jgi:predicted RNA binding protein YcfA (HicA-like mRNA interferase family)